MADNFSTFVMSETTLNQIKVLPPETQLKYFWAVTNFGIDGIEPDFEGLELAIWIPMRDLINKNRACNIGKYHWNWKGGITPENHKVRESAEYKHWIKAVYKRDNYTCQYCGQKGGKLNAHHIKPFAKNTELRLSVENGITYCEKCHKKWHKRHGRG